MRTDEEFRLNRQLSNRKWLKANPDYWKQYRHEHPEKVDRNRQLQIIRNRSRRQAPKNGPAGGDGVIAKIDALKVRIYEITVPYR